MAEHSPPIPDDLPTCKAQLRAVLEQHAALLQRFHDLERQLDETCRLVAEAVGFGPEKWKLVYQSRSGRPTDPWLGPDILDHVAELANQTLFPRAQSWYMGANIPGKKREMLVYPGGLPFYLQNCKETADAGYAGFVLS